MTPSLPRLALLGPESAAGAALLRRLRRRSVRVVGCDLARPAGWRDSDPFEEIDLCEGNAADRLAALWRRERVEAVVHSALRSHPSGDPERDRDLERVGTPQVLRACEEAGVGKLVLASSTMLYGARADNALYLSETEPLRGHPEAHCVAGRIAVEQLVAGWRSRHPTVEVTVLRNAWILGPRVSGRVVDHFTAPRVRVLLGYDPLMQFVHEDDCARYYEAALVAAKSGVYNLVARGVAPLRTLLRLAGSRILPLPRRVWYRMREHDARDGDGVAGFYDYLRYPWVADGSRAWSAFGEPRYTTRETWMALHSARRVREFA